MADPIFLFRDPKPIAVQGNDAWQSLAPASATRDRMVIAVAGPGTVFVRIKNAGPNATAGLPLAAGHGWQILTRDTFGDFITREWFVFAPAGTNVRGFYVDGPPTE